MSHINVNELNILTKFNLALCKTLSFDKSFNVDISDIKWNDFSSLSLLEFGHDFNQDICCIRWPDSLRTLTFGANFNTEINYIDDCGGYINYVNWNNINCITFGNDFNKIIRDIDWSSVTDLRFGASFNQCVYDIDWSKLRVLLFSNNFNQLVSCAVFPELITLSFGNMFDQMIMQITWPNVTHLTFGRSFNRVITEGKYHSKIGNGALITLPTAIKILTFGQNFNTDISFVNLFAIEELHFGVCFNQSLSFVEFPMSLHTVTLGVSFTQDISDVKFPGLCILYDRANRITQHSCAFPNSMYKIIHCMYNNVVVYERQIGGHTKAARR
jgi:hypothetical protein